MMIKAVTQDELDVFQQTMLRLSYAERRSLTHRLETFDLTLAQYMVLRALEHRNTAGQTMSELAEATHQVTATMTGIVDRLEANELVIRKRDSNDRRAQRVSITARGQSLLEEINRLSRLRLEKFFLRLTAEERSVLQAALDHYLELSVTDFTET